MDALLNPARRASGGIKWRLVVHTAAMFSCVTAFTVTNFTVLSTSYINNRGFGGSDALSPGPFGYQSLSYSGRSISVAQYIMFFLNNWFADGLLVSSISNRIFQASNPTAPALSLLCYLCQELLGYRGPVLDVPRFFRCVLWPFIDWRRHLAHTAGTASGVILVYQSAQPSGGVWTCDSANFGYPYFLISLSLNILLTFMIVTRLAWYNRILRSAMGPLLRTKGLYNAVSAMLVESLALYTVNFILVIAAWGLKSYIAYTFFPALAETQVRFALVCRNLRTLLPNACGE